MKFWLTTIVAILTFLTPMIGSLFALYSKVEAHTLYIEGDQIEKSELRKDLKKVLEDTSIIKGQLQEMKRGN
jgi:hypothetical protein